jgi:hypothetical protein
MVADREIQNSRNPYVNHWPELGKGLAVLNGGLWVSAASSERHRVEGIDELYAPESRRPALCETH